MEKPQAALPETVQEDKTSVLQTLHRRVKYANKVPGRKLNTATTEANTSGGLEGHGHYI